MIIGHAGVSAALHAALPPVTLLSGPASVGKFTLARALAVRHCPTAADRRIYPDGLTATDARQIIALTNTAPLGTCRIVAARLTQTTSPATLNILLKSLEEPPPTARFLLSAAGPVPATVTSRATHYRLGLLTGDQLIQVLITCGISPAQAARAAAAGWRQVTAAIQAIGDTDPGRAGALALARALEHTDRDAFDKTVSGCAGADLRAALHTLLVEILTGRWRHYTPAEAPGLSRRQALAMLRALSALAQASPRLGIKAALEPFLTPP